MAPELIRGDKYHGEKVDLFACGIILFIMLFKKFPFPEGAHNKKSPYSYLAENKSQIFWKAHDRDKKFSDDVKGLITSMLNPKPQLRPYLIEIMYHPWMQGPTASTEEI